MRSSAECDHAQPAWIWCDDFEKDRLTHYFEFDSSHGDFVRAAGVGIDGSYGIRSRFSAGQVSAGALHLAIGRTPAGYMRPVDAGRSDYREVYWRVYMRYEPGWTGGGGHKISRAQILTNAKWAQAMVVPVWGGDTPQGEDYLQIDPARGTDRTGAVRTTSYNDSRNLTFLGEAQGSKPIFDAAHIGSWYCIEAHVRLNDSGAENGVFEVWIDGDLDAQRNGLNLVGGYREYGINNVFLESYWNGGAPRGQERYFDNFVVSTQRIGCRVPAQGTVQ